MNKGHTQRLHAMLSKLQRENLDPTRRTAEQTAKKLDRALALIEKAMAK